MVQSEVTAGADASPASSDAKALRNLKVRTVVDRSPMSNFLPVNRASLASRQDAKYHLGRL